MNEKLSENGNRVIITIGQRKVEQNSRIDHIPTETKNTAPKSPLQMKAGVQSLGFIVSARIDPIHKGPAPGKIPHSLQG